MTDPVSDTQELSRRPGDRRMKAILVLAGAVGFVVAPTLTNGFAGFSPDLFPVPQDRPPVQPAGYAFAIWGPIYLALLAHAVLGLFGRAEDTGWDRSRWPLVLSLAVGASWIAVAQVSAVWATVLIWTMWAGAVAALLIGRFAAGWPDRWLGQLPLGVYAGWLTAASWVAVGLMLGGFGVLSEGWAAALALLGAAGLAVAVQTALGRAPEYGLTVIWALVGVVVANLGAGNWALAGLAVLGLAAVGMPVLRVLRAG